MRDADRCRGEDPYRITALVTRAQQPSTLSCCKAGIYYFVLLFQPRAPRGARGELTLYTWCAKQKWHSLRERKHSLRYRRAVHANH